MSLRVRWWIAVAFLAAGLAGQELLRAHLTEVPLPAPAELQLPLAGLPRKIGPWQAEDLPLAADAQYADEHLKRRYHHPERNQSLVLWAVYARDGEDRKHHPEVCMAVAGRQEERQERQTLELDGPGAAGPAIPISRSGGSRVGFLLALCFAAALGSPAGLAATDLPTGSRPRLQRDAGGLCPLPGAGGPGGGAAVRARSGCDDPAARRQPGGAGQRAVAGHGDGLCDGGLKGHVKPRRR